MTDEQNDSNSTREEDEVSIVDLMVVLLRHRRMITVAILGAIILSLGTYFLYPGYKYRQASENRLVEAHATFLVNPAVAAILGKEDSVNYIMQGLNDPILLLSALRKTGFTELNDGTRLDDSLDDATVLAAIHEMVQIEDASAKSLKTTQGIHSAALDNGIATIIFRDRDAAKAKEFLTVLVSVVNNSISAYLQPRTTIKLEAYEQLLSIENPRALEAMEIAKGYVSYAIIKNYLAEKSVPLSILRDPYVVQPNISQGSIKADILKKSVLMVFAVAFMSILVAFILQYIETVKSDPKSMAKIHEALKKH